MKKTLIFFLFNLLLVTQAFSYSLKVDAGLSSITGNTAYEISFGEYVPYYGTITGKSKLEFDLDAAVASVTVEAGFFDEELMVSFNYGKSVVTYDANLRDRDWFHNDYLNMFYDPLMGDTDSSIESDLAMYDFRLKWHFLSLKNDTVKLRAVAGYLHQEWGEFEAKGATGYYSGILNESLGGSKSPVNLPETILALTYEVEYSVLFVGLCAEFNINDKWFAELGLELGIPEAEDVDNHVLRNKISRGDAEGSFGDYTSLRAKLGYVIDEFWSVTAELAVLDIETDGDQTQSDYVNVDAIISSEQTSLSVKASYKFQ